MWAAGEDDEAVVLAKLNVEEMGEERSDSTPSSSEDELETSLENAGHLRSMAARLRISVEAASSCSSVRRGVVVGTSKGDSLLFVVDDD